MRRLLLPFLIALVPLIAFAGGETEIMEINPLSENNLNHFKKEGEAEWGLDSESDDLHTYITCRKVKSDASLVFRRRAFKQGFRLTIEVLGGSKGKNLEAYVFEPKEGERIQVPFKKRWLAKKGWHKLVITVEDGQAWARVDDEEDERVTVPKKKDLTFALTVKKRSEGTFRRPEIKFLVVSDDQRAPEEGFIRIFDGKTLDGWKTYPEGVKNYKITGQSIDVAVPMEQEYYGDLVFDHGRFRDFEIRMRVAQGARNLLLVGRGGAEGQRPTQTAVEAYFPGDTDWNDVELVVKGRHVTLNVNGQKRWEERSAVNDQPFTVYIRVGRDGHAKIRDIRVRGRNLRPGASWSRYTSQSAPKDGVGGAVGVGGRGKDQPRPAGEQSKNLFNGKDLLAPDWRMFGSQNVWGIYDGRIVGMAQGQTADSVLYYAKLIYSDYRLTFKLQRETQGAKFLARLLPPKDGEQSATVADFKKEWFNQEEPWTEFDIEVFGPDLTVKAAGKVVHRGKVPPDAGYFGWILPPNAVIGIQSIVWHRPKRR